jgi:hypothetical protein
VTPPTILEGRIHEFDQWFAGSIAELHGMDASGPVPPMPTRKL